MEHTTTLEREARKTSIELEPLWSPKASDIEVVSRLRTILEEDRATKIQIDAPTANADVCSPVRVTVTWTRPAQAGSFQAQLDGKDITGQFTVSETTMKATALLELEGGTDPTLSASVVMYRWLPTPGPRRMEADASFHVPAPRWDLTVSGTIGSDGLPIIDVLPGTTPVRITITPTQCTPPDLAIKAFTGFGLADQVPGISFQIPFTIPKGSSYGFLKVTIDPAVKAGTYFAYAFAQTAQDIPVGTAETLRGFYLNVLPH
jgi:hypothetical protein